MSRRKQAVFGALSAAMALLVGYVFVEIGFRVYLYATNEIDATFPGIAILDQPLPSAWYMRAPGNVFGPYFPSTTYQMMHIGADNRPVNPHRFHTNNLGWVSHYDYAVEKPPDEFRTAVIGASLVASTTNENPWPDALQRYLDNDEKLRALLGVRRITVMNFGGNGGTLQTMVDPGLATALRFSPDFVVLNFATSNVTMPQNAPTPKLKKEAAAIPGKPYPGEVQNGFIVDGVIIDLLCPYGAWAPSISNPRCVAGRQWVIEPSRQISPTEIGNIKRHVAKAILRKRLILSRFPTAAYYLLGYPVFRARLASPEQQKVDGQHIALMVFQAIHDIYPHVLFAHNPLDTDLGGNQEWNDVVTKLSAAAREHNFDFEKLAEFLPIQLGKTEWEKWYIKDDGHWSDYGAEAYGRAIYLALRNRLLVSRGLPPAWDRSPCLESFNHFKEAELAEARKDQDLALHEYEEAISLLPPDANEVFYRKEGYRACGFLPTLLTSYALQLDARGDSRADEAGERAREFSPYDFYRFRAANRKGRGNLKAAVADYGEMIALRPDSVEALQSRAEANLLLGNAAAAAEDYSALLRITPDNFGLVFGRAQARILSMDFEGAFSDCNRLIEHYPNEAAFRHIRALAEYNLGRGAEALADLDRVLTKLPDLPASLQLRAKILSEDELRNSRTQ